MNTGSAAFIELPTDAELCPFVLVPVWTITKITPVVNSRGDQVGAMVGNQHGGVVRTTLSAHDVVELAGFACKTTVELHPQGEFKDE